MKINETSQIVMKIHSIYGQDRFANSAELASRTNYWDIYFKDFSFDIVNKALDYWIKSHRDMPTPSDLLPKCKDLRFELLNPPIDFANPENIKPTWELIYDARHGELKDEDISPEIRKMSDEFVKWLRADPKLKAQWKAQQNNKPIQSADMGNVLPYEI